MLNSFLLRAKAATIQAAAPDKSQLRALQPILTEKLQAVGIKFWPTKQLEGNLYPTLGQFQIAKYNWQLNTQEQVKNKLTLSLGLRVDDSNEVYRDQPGGKAHLAAEKELKKIVSLFRKAGIASFKIQEPRVSGGTQSPAKAQGVMKMDVVAPERKEAPGKPEAKGKWGIKVSSGDGQRSHVFTGTENSRGPWSSKDEASGHVSDLKQQLAYDDDFKYPSFQVVPV